MYVFWLFCIQRKTRGPSLPPPAILHPMDEGTLKTQSLNVFFTGHFCLGWWSNFVGSEPGQKQSVNSCRIWSTTNLNTPPPPLHSHTLFVYIVHLVLEGGEGEGGQREGWGATVHKYSSFVHGGNSSQEWSKIPTWLMTLPPVYKLY